MAANPQLKRLRAETEICSLVAYVDLETSMVLAWDADKIPRQERLNELARITKDILTGSDGHAIGTTIMGGAKINHATMIDRTEANVFIRSDTDDADALCCIAPSNAVITTLSAIGKTFLEGLNDP